MEILWKYFRDVSIRRSDYSRIGISERTRVTIGLKRGHKKSQFDFDYNGIKNRIRFNEIAFYRHFMWFYFFLLEYYFLRERLPCSVDCLGIFIFFVTQSLILLDFTRSFLFFLFICMSSQLNDVLTNIRVFKYAFQRYGGEKYANSNVFRVFL